MPADKKKRTTSDTNFSTLKQEVPPLPDQPTFHEHLRDLTRRAVRVVIEEVMREVPLKTFRSPEIVMEIFIPRCLIATVATNLTSQRV